MVRPTLFIKSIRDIKKSLVQFVSIFLMSMIAISIVTGLDSIWVTMKQRSEHMYEQTDLSDLWVTVPNPSERDMWKVKRLEGVEKAEKRLVVNCDVDLPESPTLRMYAMPSGYSVNRPYPIAGNIKTSNGAVLDQSFAKANHLSIGDKVKVKINEVWVEFTVEELALSSEHILSIQDSSSMVPDSKKYGFVMVDIDAVSKAYGGQKVYNQVSVCLTEDASEEEVKSGLEQIFGDRLGGIVNHKDHTSIENTYARMNLFRILSKVFPSIFFLVTALITLSTMVRLVEDQRNQIGILKAFGYGKREIMWHYTSYGIYVGAIGSLSGIIVGPNVIGRILMKNLKLLYIFPDYRLELNITNIILCTLLIVLSTGGISCYSSLKLLGEVPAELLRTKPPKKGNHIFLERFQGIWNSLKFSSKLIARNISKNKARMGMSILGVMGCSGLIIGALSLKTMINGLSEQTFDDMYSYDQRMTLDSDVSHRYIKNLKINGDFQDMEETNIQVTTNDGVMKMVKITLLPEESPLIHLSDTNGNSVTMPEEGIMITHKLAELLGVTSGDTIQLKMPNDKNKEVKVVGLIQMTFGQGIYAKNSYWEALGGDYNPGVLLVKWKDQPDQNLLNSSRIIRVVEKVQQKKDFESNIKIVNVAAVMLIVSGSSLAFVVIYNMSILNFFERVRDLATLKVLGFYENEIRYLVLFENFISTLAGIVLGIPVGKLIVTIFVSGFGDDFDLNGKLSMSNILVSAVLTVLFMILVNMVVSKKMKKIDMLEALKSVE